MITIEKTDVYGFEAAIRGLRNPMNSWGKSDSKLIPIDEEFRPGHFRYEIGDNDLKLMQNLVRSGSDHSKFMRMINVTLDITAPLYWWKELDTYKIGTVANSCSTMHKIHAKEFTLDDFSVEHLHGIEDQAIKLKFKTCGLPMNFESSSLGCLEIVVAFLNYYRNRYLESKDKIDWWQMIQLLPSSYNQHRTVQLNYQVLRNMYFARRNHKLDEWREFCSWIETLPYAKELICIGGENDDH